MYCCWTSLSTCLLLPHLLFGACWRCIGGMEGSRTQSSCWSLFSYPCLYFCIHMGFSMFHPVRKTGHLCLACRDFLSLGHSSSCFFCCWYCSACTLPGLDWISWRGGEGCCLLSSFLFHIYLFHFDFFQRLGLSGCMVGTGGSDPPTYQISSYALL